MPKRTNKTYYNRKNTCDRCEINFDIAIGHPYREYDIDGNWTGKWNCNNCYEKYDPNSQRNLIKSMRDRRTNNQDSNSSNAKGDNFQELTCRWRSTVSTIPVDDLNKKLDNYRSPIDHTPDSELGIIQTAGRLYDSYNRCWSFGSLEREWYKEFDYEMCYCVSKDGKNIERIYITPNKEIKDKRKSIVIYKSHQYSRGPSWYDDYLIRDEEILRKVNEIWKQIIEEV